MQLSKQNGIHYFFVSPVSASQQLTTARSPPISSFGQSAQQNASAACTDQPQPQRQQQHHLAKTGSTTQPQQQPTETEL